MFENILKLEPIFRKCDWQKSLWKEIPSFLLRWFKHDVEKLEKFNVPSIGRWDVW